MKALLLLLKVDVGHFKRHCPYSYHFYRFYQQFCHFHGWYRVNCTEMGINKIYYVLFIFDKYLVTAMGLYMYNSHSLLEYPIICNRSHVHESYSQIWRAKTVNLWLSSESDDGVASCFFFKPQSTAVLTQSGVSGRPSIRSFSMQFMAVRLYHCYPAGVARQ